MRVTAQTKEETRHNIVRAARKLFATKGWEQTTTRRIAEAAGIATGTLFNYFESKEAIVSELLSDALAKAQDEMERRKAPGQSLEEELFSLIWTELAGLREFRRFLPSAAETIFSPLRRLSTDSRGDLIRNNHLEAVDRLVVRHGAAGPLPALKMQLYWTLYLGVFAHWASDESPNQEDTLAVLDQTLKLFVALLHSDAHATNKRPAERTHQHVPAIQGTHRRSSKGRRDGRKPR